MKIKLQVLLFLSLVVANRSKRHSDDTEGTNNHEVTRGGKQNLCLKCYNICNACTRQTEDNSEKMACKPYNIHFYGSHVHVQIPQPDAVMMMMKKKNVKTKWKHFSMITA